MSDYIFSSKSSDPNKLSDSLKSIYKNNLPECFFYHGEWGCLCVTESRYSGFRPFENEQHIFVVIGAPVLYFRDNCFLTKADSHEGTEAIYSRWVIDQNMHFDVDLSGPFNFILIDKKSGLIKVVTDLMSFIPVFETQSNEDLFLSTHVDVLAKASGKEKDFDRASLVDFILNNVITFPYTAYANTHQLAPGSVIKFLQDQEDVECYWKPYEKNNFNNVEEAACSLRQGITSYVNNITVNMNKVAQFISGGEDSRALSGILSSDLDREAFIFLDSMNREGEIAKKVAQSYGAKFNIGLRKGTHYIDILEESSCLVGLGHQFTHSHSLGFDKKFNLKSYSAVFGGYLSDSLLKAAYARKVKGQNRLSFIPDIPLAGETRTKPLTHDFFDKELLSEIDNRRLNWFHKVKDIRPNSAHEWFVLYPASMRSTIPNFYSTRRLFKSYEPFMSHEVVKVSASVPASWKFNKKLFNRAMRPFLARSKWILHADGRFPYFNWWFSFPLILLLTCYRISMRLLGFVKHIQGPWYDWRNIIKSQAWAERFRIYGDCCSYINFNLENKDKLSLDQKFNLIQVLHKISGKNVSSRIGQ